MSTTETKKFPQPFQDRVVVSRKKAERTSPGGIIIPEMAVEENISQGTVIAIGPEVGKKTTIDKSPQPGDFVQFGEYAGSTITYEGEEYLIMRESDIMCKL